MANDLLYVSTTKHLAGDAVSKHLLRFGPINSWVTIESDQGKNTYAYAVTDYTSSAEYAGVQNYGWQTMAAQTAWGSGFTPTMMYGGWSVTPSRYAVYDGSEGFSWNTAWHFTIPAILNGHTITAARIVMCSPTCLVRNQYGDLSGISDFSWSGALRLKFATSLLTPIACLQSGYQLQVAANSLTAATTAAGAAKDTYDIWDWDSYWGYAALAYHVPMRAPTVWVPWDLPSAVATMMNSNRSAWMHAGFTQDYFSNAFLWLACASIRGFALQVYVV